MYSGIPGDKEKSTLVKSFKVKAGVADSSPTPLPQLLGREYWLITDKQKVSIYENPQTAPYFLTLDIPVSDMPPYGPEPYPECGNNCDWILPGYFGLHGVGDDESRVSDQDPGSSGCVRHKNEDIEFLYTLLDPQNSEIRYYIEDI